MIHPQQDARPGFAQDAGVPLPEASVTGLVLAGGQARRMGGVDKGLLTLGGLALVQWALQRLRAQSAAAALAGCAINANRHLEAYAGCGVPVWPDAVAGFAGPLAGFAAGLQHCQTPFMFAVPCDAPLLPLDLLERLAQALLAQQADVALAAAPGEDGVLRLQPVFALLRASTLPSLLGYLQQGGHKVETWSRQQRLAIAPFDRPDDDPSAFSNLNTPEELERLERLQAGGADCLTH